jgi:hypothetical protein
MQGLWCMWCCRAAIVVGDNDWDGVGRVREGLRRLEFGGRPSDILLDWSGWGWCKVVARSAGIVKLRCEML